MICCIELLLERGIPAAGCYQQTSFGSQPLQRWPRLWTPISPKNLPVSRWPKSNNRLEGGIKPCYFGQCRTTVIGHFSNCFGFDFSLHPIFLPCPSWVLIPRVVLNNHHTHWTLFQSRPPEEPNL